MVMYNSIIVFFLYNQTLLDYAFDLVFENVEN